MPFTFSAATTFSTKGIWLVRAEKQMLAALDDDTVSLPMEDEACAVGQEHVDGLCVAFSRRVVHKNESTECMPFHLGR